ncbi:CPBP family intramembrane metalloprotease [SAR202 cluster bacterium AD-804-J14_MRT_500m]|nr:CPBP family intramembrane metalloprotease [SAR202 cluster bacterium AD-804-J14_MRT_500m]
MSESNHLTVGSVPWNSFDVFAALGSVIAGFVVLAMAILQFQPETGPGAASLVISALITSCILFASSWAFGPLKHGVSVVTLGFCPPNFSTVGLRIFPVLVLVSALVVNGVYSILVGYWSLEFFEPPELPNFSINTAILTGVFFVVVGPLAEEVFFRGFALQGISQRFGVKTGVIGSSLLFGILHFNLVVPTFLIGVLLAFLFVRTRSVFPCFFVHSAHNGLVFITSVVS